MGASFGEHRLVLSGEKSKIAPRSDGACGVIGSNARLGDGLGCEKGFMLAHHQSVCRPGVVQLLPGVLRCVPKRGGRRSQVPWAAFSDRAGGAAEAPNRSGVRVRAGATALSTRRELLAWGAVLSAGAVPAAPARADELLEVPLVRPPRGYRSPPTQPVGTLPRVDIAASTLLSGSITRR